MIDWNDPEPKIYGLNVGVITTNKDPRGLGRVRIRIPGVVEPETAWAFPLGATGGGNKDRGVFWPPDEGSEVGVFFNQGDPDHPYYLPAQWGAPGGDPEVPTASQGGDPNVRVLAFGQYDIVVDQRAGAKSFTIVDKDASDNVIQFDGTTRKLTISSTVGIDLKSNGQITIQGLLVTINGVAAGLGQL